ncbi:MAG: hypothetical protein GY790_21385 [Bacteroidetes bacterium]|nr:hypothetical protein [Bacteroidota bacterium]
MRDIFANCIGFDWDEGNSEKNWILHQVSRNDSSEYVDWDVSGKVTFSNLKPTTKTISLRLPEYIIDELKVLAHKKDVPYQSLIKIFLKDRIDQELRQAL